MLDFPDPDTVPAYVPKEQSSGRFKVSPVGLKESLVPRQRVVEDLIEQGTVNMIFGESSVGKSFVVVDLASSIANGSDWMGHPTVDGLSFFVAAEGASDLGNRCAAWRQFRNTGNREVHQVTPTDFCFTAVDVRDLIAVIQTAVKKAGLPARLVVIDTLAKTLGKLEENSATDMSSVTEACSKIASETSAAVVIVHHKGKGGDVRGSSALRANADNVFEVSGEGQNKTMRVKKRRSGEAGAEYSFRLAPVTIDIGQGTNLGSLAVEFRGPKSAPRALTNAASSGGLLLGILKGTQSKGLLFTSNATGIRYRAVPYADAKAAAIAANPSRIKDDSKRKKFQRELEELIAQGVIFLKGHDVFVPI